MRRSKIILWVGLILVVAAGAVYLFLRGGQEVATVEVQKGSINRTVNDTGYVQPASGFNIHATQMARVKQVVAGIGQQVSRGETLLVLENLDLALQIGEVQAQIDQSEIALGGAQAALGRLNLELADAQDHLARLEALFKAGAVTKAELDKASLQVEICRQNINQQNSNLASAQALRDGLSQTLSRLYAKEEQLVVKSPVSGIVLNLPARQEEVVNPGSPLVSLAAAGQLEVKADLLSDDLAEVKTGQKVTITAPVLGEHRLIGEVQQIYPRAEEKVSALGIIQRRVPVIIALPDGGVLKPGYEVKVAIETQSREDVLILPREAVRTAVDGHKEVMMVVDGRIQLRQVQTGLSDRDNIEITGGLAAGDIVVKDSSLHLKGGIKVTPIS
jgi:HlyD family secretion protein